MKPLLISLLFFSSLLFGQTKPTEDQFIETTYRATALLYAQDADGSMNMRCTATAIEKTEKGYIFVTASHCVGEDDPTKERVEPDKTFFFITSDAPGQKEFLKAKLIAAGYKHRGDDFSLFSVDTKQTFPIVDLGEDVKNHSGEPVLNISSPFGLGKQTFRGIVSSPLLDRLVHVEDINWTDAMMVSITGVNGGSSGSAIVCLNQRAICGFLVGTIGGTETVAIPVDRFKKFRQDVAAHKYKWFKSEDEQ